MAEGRANRLGIAVILPFSRAHGRTPRAATEIEPRAVDRVARRIGLGATPHDGLDPAARMWKRHRAEIRALFGYREATVADAEAEALEGGLRDQAATAGAVADHLVARLEARRGELASNRREDHEVCMLALHLLQNCMIYVNTPMLQQVLARPHRRQKLEARDLSALTPLIWEHANPYGRFELDLNARIPLD